MPSYLLPFYLLAFGLVLMWFNTKTNGNRHPFQKAVSFIVGTTAIVISMMVFVFLLIT